MTPEMQERAARRFRQEIMGGQGEEKGGREEVAGVAREESSIFNT